MSHLRASDGTVLCEHDDARDELHALLAAPAVELAHSHDHDPEPSAASDTWPRPLFRRACRLT